MKKRFFRAVLSASLAVSAGALVPAAAGAAPVGTTAYVCQIGSTKYASVHAALASVTGNARATIAMLANATDTSNEYP